MTIGERIKQKRLELGMSQEELATKCGYKSRSSINKIELARDLPLNKVSLVANALGCTESYIMGWNEEQEKAESYGSLVAEIIRDEDMMQILEYSKNLQPTQRKQVADYIKFLLQSSESEGK